MAISAKNGILLSALSALNGIARASIGALNGVAAGGGGGSFDSTVGGNTGNTYTGLQMCYIEAGDPTVSRDDPTGFDPFGGDTRALLRPTGVSNIAALGTITLTTATLYIYLTNVFGDSGLDAYRCLRNWIGAEADWNEFATGSSWTTAGGSGSGTDRSASPIGNVSWVDGVSDPGYVAISLDLTTMAALINSGPNHGVMLVGNASAYGDIAGTAGTDGQRPYFHFAGTYS